MTVLTPTVEADVVATPSGSAPTGKEILYTLVVTNTSNGPVTIDLANTIPTDTTYVQGSATGGIDSVEPTASDDHVAWFGELAQSAGGEQPFSKNYP